MRAPLSSQSGSARPGTAASRPDARGANARNTNARPPSPIEELTDLDAKADDDSPFPSMKKIPAQDRADEIIVELKEAILNPGRVDGSSGMMVGDWSKLAHKKIIKAIRDAEMSATMRELMSAKRIGGLCLRVGFLLLASVAAFAAFWFGVVFVWDTYGPVYGIGAVASAIGLSLGFVIAGIMMSGEDVEEIRGDIKRRFGNSK